MSAQLQALVDRLYNDIGTPVTLVDIANQLVAYSMQPPELIDQVRRETTLAKQLDPASLYVHDHADTARTLARVPANPELGVVERAVLPLTINGAVTGRLYFIDPEHRVSEKVLAPYQAELAQAARLVELRRLTRIDMELLIGGLLDAKRGVRRTAAEVMQESRVFDQHTDLRVVVVDDARVMKESSGTAWSTVIGRDIAYATLAGRLILVMPSIEVLDAGQIRAAVSTLAADPLLAGQAGVGIGSRVPRLVNARKSYRQALRCLQLVRSGLYHANIAEWDRIGSWRTILACGEERATASIDPRVQAMLRHEPFDLLHVTRRYVERQTDASALAKDLHMHRATLYTRGRRLQERYGLRWDDPGDRLSTIIGLRIGLLYGHRDNEESSSTHRPIG